MSGEWGRLGVGPTPQIEQKTIQHLSKILSDAALWEGRGNSGIILSQIFKGIYLGLKDKDLTTTNIVSSSLECAFNSAYASIANPTEGTILTVLRDIAEESRQQVLTKRTFSDLLAALSIKAKESVDSTPNHLELLRDAEIVEFIESIFTQKLQVIQLT